MENFKSWLNNISPDIGATFARFPFAILLSALSTIVFILLLNDFFDTETEPLFRLAFGLSFAAVFAVAGLLYSENRSRGGVIPAFFAFVLPIIVVGLMQIETTEWVVSFMLGPISLLWLSIAPSFGLTSNDGEVVAKDAPPDKVFQTSQKLFRQDLFWWLNHRAITTATIAGFGFLLIAAGFIALENSLSALFGLRVEKLFYQYLLPFTGLFLTPVYWLSTIPKLSDFDEAELKNPDFLSRAIGFLGQFIMAPFLFIYALILLVYGVQILLVGELPHGMLSWMVLGFVIAGAGTWLLLHPSFMHSRLLVKYFRKFWFWLTVIPIILYFMAVFTRLDAYGLTSDRAWLLVGGIWAALLTLAFLSKKFSDIRLIPGLALVLISLASVGPWNFVNAPKVLQAIRLENSLYNAVPLTLSTGGTYEWTEENAQIARGAIRYLVRADSESPRLYAILDRQGIDYENRGIDYRQIYSMLDLGLEQQANAELVWRNYNLEDSSGVDMSQVPFLLGIVKLSGGVERDIAGLSFDIVKDKILVKVGGEVLQTLDLNSWLLEQESALIIQPVVNFSLNENNYRLIVSALNIRLKATIEKIDIINSIEAMLFSNSPPPSINLP